MKKKIALLSVLSLVSLLTLGSCNSGENNHSSSQIASIEEAPSWAEGKTKLDTSSLTGEVKTTTMVRIHYTRPRNDYKKWALHIWETIPDQKPGVDYPFDKYEDEGVVADIELSKISDGTIKQIGFIVKNGGPGEWNGKDIEQDRFINIPETTSDGIYDIFLTQGDRMISESRDEANQEHIAIAYGDTLKRKNGDQLIATVKFKLKTTKLEIDKVKLYEDNKEITSGFTKRTYGDGSNVQFMFDENFSFDFRKSYSVKYPFGGRIDEAKLKLSKLYGTKQFGDLYNYNGNDLGVTFNELKTTTTFKLWAPLSDKVELKLYNKGTLSENNQAYKTIPMVRGEKGVFSVTVEEYLHAKYYNYVVTNGKEVNEVVDPYAKSCGLNGNIGMVVDFDVINEELDWANVTRPTDPNVNYNVDNSIYEVHIRDMTIDPNSGVSAKNRGKFLGLSEENTSYTNEGVRVSTGLAHLKELGVSHIQIQPFYDYNSVDESKKDGYNWGYDPKNYNCLEGSYSTDPSDGLSRVKEFKTMMKALLKNGIQVNMDVVYNHTAESAGTNFEKIIPGYYHRLNDEFSFSNGSGCGNEMASENFMYRKFIVDSTKFFLDEYKLSGFRFDLMELIDTETMEEVYKECAKIYDKVMIYGEPWAGGNSTLYGNLRTNKSTIPTLKGTIGAFNDVARNSIRGDNNLGQGFVQGSNGQGFTLMKTLKGSFAGKMDPNRSLTYASCHDNYTLFDQLDKSLDKHKLDKSNLIKQYRMAENLVFMSQGVPFFQEGEDFLRTKKAGKGEEVHNSYKAGDHVNMMDYELKRQNRDMFRYFKELIELRKNHSALRLNTQDQVETGVKFIDQDLLTQGTIVYTCQDQNEKLLIIHTNSPLKDYDLGGGYALIFNDKGKVTDSSVVTKVSCEAHTTLVFQELKKD